MEGAGVDNGGDAQTRVPLTELADRYQAVKEQVADGLRARQLATRFGGKPPHGDGPSGDGAAPPEKQDARRIAAGRLGAGVSHTTLEKVLWLRRAAFDLERRASLRRAAFDALEEVDETGRVDWPYGRVQTLVLMDDLEQTAAQAPRDSALKRLAGHRLKLLRDRGVHGITAAMRRETREALAAARRTDRVLEELARHFGEWWTGVDSKLGRRSPEDEARRVKVWRARLAGGGRAGPDGGANP
ncbi:MAG: hypothetical protein LBK95_01470 [Bifidobacteriaceae bacterium]|jgi:hypothetical protein|nr:hypothetical protein [Bifidobacteriaceae bacterium]